jgi:aminopeptidase-like protein
MIEEVMLDRWLLDQIDEEYDLIDMDENSFVPVEELSQDVLELLS